MPVELVFQSPGHQHQPALQPGPPEVVLRRRGWQPTQAAQLSQPGIQFRRDRLDQLQGQQGDQGDAPRHRIRRGFHRWRQRDQGRQPGPALLETMGQQQPPGALKPLQQQGFRQATVEAKSLGR